MRVAILASLSLLACDMKREPVDGRFSIYWSGGVGLVCDTKTGSEYLFVDRSGGVPLQSTCEKRNK